MENNSSKYYAGALLRSALPCAQTELPPFHRCPEELSTTPSLAHATRRIPLISRPVLPSKLCLPVPNGGNIVYVRVAGFCAHFRKIKCRRPEEGFLVAVNSCTLLSGIHRDRIISSPCFHPGFYPRMTSLLHRSHCPHGLETSLRTSQAQAI